MFFLSPPTMATHLNASKISCYVSLVSPKLSLLSQNARGSLYASNSIYIILVVLKTSFLIQCNSFFCLFPSFFLLNFASFLLDLSLN
jgi:hypothetical protein